MAEWKGVFEDSWGDITKVSPSDNRYLWILVPSPAGPVETPLMPLTDIAINKFLKPGESYTSTGKFGCDSWEVMVDFVEVSPTECEVIMGVKISGPDGYVDEYKINDGKNLFADDPIIYDHNESDLGVIAPFIGVVPGFKNHADGGNHSDNPHLENDDKDIVLKTKGGKTYVIRETEIGEQGDDIESKFDLKMRAYASGRPYYYRTGTADKAAKLAKEAVESGECEDGDVEAITKYVNEKMGCGEEE